MQIMKAMVLEKQGDPLVFKEVPKPNILPEQLLVKVSVCGVCRTDLHILDGELTQPNLPLILGHQIVGTVEAIGTKTKGFSVGDRVGIPWLGFTCGCCSYCNENRENLCDNAQYTGYTLNGGFAEYAAAYASHTFKLPQNLEDAEVAPLLCAGLIGYRCLSKTEGAKKLGLYGFGAAAHIVTQIAVYEGREVYAFTRPGDNETQKFALKLGAKWAGDSNKPPPENLDAAIIFAPVGDLVPASLKILKKGGKCICGGIHMSDIPSFPYKDLWEERMIESVANLTREDGEGLLKAAEQIPIKTTVTTYPLEEANRALEDLRNGRFDGAAVLIVEH